MKKRLYMHASRMHTSVRTPTLCFLEAGMHDACTSVTRHSTSYIVGMPARCARKRFYSQPRLLDLFARP